jgi:Protein of unknown function (DUF3352)
MPLRRAGWSVLVLLVAIGACRKIEEAPEGGAARLEAPGRVATEAVAADLPAGAATVVSAHDLQGFWNRLESTQLYAQLRAIPEIQRALDPAQNPQLAQALGRFQASTGVPLSKETLFKTLGDKVQLGLYPTAPAAGAGADSVVLRTLLVADMEDRDALASILAGLRKQGEGQGRTFATEQYRGVDLTVVSDAGGQVDAIYGFHKDKLVAASDQAGIEQAIAALDREAPTMSADTLYERALRHVGDASLTVFVNRGGYGGLMGAMREARQAEGDTAGMDDAAAELMQKYNVQAATIAGSHWTDDGLAISSYSIFDPSSPATAPLREMLQAPPSQVAAVGYFPDSTLAFYAVNFLDAPALYDLAVAYVKDVSRAARGGEADGDPAADVDRMLAEFQRRTGMDLRTDVLGWIGREAALGVNGVVKGGFFPVPELSLVVQAADAERASSFFAKLEAALVQAAQTSGQGFPVQFQEEDYKGVRVRYAPTPLGEGLAPAYAIHEDHAVVALSRGTLKRMLDAKTGAAPGVRSNPQFQALSGFLPGEANLLGYANTSQLLAEVGSLLTTFQQMRGQGAAAGTEDTVARVIAALRNIESVGAYGVGDGEGVEQRFLVRIQ